MVSDISIPDVLLRGLYDRRKVSIFYDGFERIVEPYTIGLSKSGNSVVRVWQVSGASSSGQISGWKLLEICKISNASVTNATFQPTRPGYNPSDKGMSQIYHTI